MDIHLIKKKKGTHGAISQRTLLTIQNDLFKIGETVRNFDNKTHQRQMQTTTLRENKQRNWKPLLAHILAEE